jgi:hypothetical protein
MIFVVVVSGCGTPSPPPTPPQVLATGINPFGIAVDSTTVYVTSFDPGPLLAIPIDGGPAVPVGVQASGKGVAVDERRLYWAGSGALMACDKSNCAGSVVRLAKGGVWDIKLDATNVYWTSTGTGQIMMADKSGGAPVDGGLSVDGGVTSDGGVSSDGGAVQIATARWPYNLAVDATNVYWIDQVQPSSGVLKAPIAGGPAVQLAVSDPIEPGGLALDDDNVYYGNGSGQIFKVSKNGGPPRLLLGDVGWFPGDLAVDGTTLYVGAYTKLLSVPLAGGQPAALAVNLSGSSFIAQDATSIYVAVMGGDVLKVAK